MQLLPYFLILIFLILLLKNRVWGFSFYFACRLLLPPIVRLGPLSMNTLMAIFLLGSVLLFERNKKTVNRKRLILLVFSLIVPIGIIGFFGQIPYSFQSKDLAQFFLTELSPFVCLAYIIRSKDDLQKILKVMLWSYLCIGIWGLITYVIKMNPLYTYFMLTFAGDYEVSDFTGDGSESIRGALTASASGNTSGPLPWGQESMLIALFLLFFKKETLDVQKTLIIAVVLLASLNTFLTGKRSCLLPFILALGYYIWQRKWFTLRNLSLSIGCLLVIYIALNLIPGLEGINKNIASTIFFWDDSLAEKNGVTGSNVGMRQAQFEYANRMVSSNILCGLGFDYPAFYSSKYGTHPVMLGFESIYFNVLVSSGVLGILVWIMFFKRLISFTYRNKKSFGFILAFHGGFILSCILTAIQSSMWIYLILSILYIKNDLISHGSINYNSHLQSRKVH